MQVEDESPRVIAKMADRLKSPFTYRTGDQGGWPAAATLRQVGGWWNEPPCPHPTPPGVCQEGGGGRGSVELGNVTCQQ